MSEKSYTDKDCQAKEATEKEKQEAKKSELITRIVELIDIGADIFNLSKEHLTIICKALNKALESK